MIDTSVARAASLSQKQIAVQCWETLETFKSYDYCLAMSGPLQNEWLKREPDRPADSWAYYVSRYALTWLTAMEAGARIAWVDLPVESTLRDTIMATAYQIYPSESHAPEAIVKDILLVETALLADHRVISLNDRERRRFQHLASHIADLRSVFWTDPQREDVPAWLRAGAPEEDPLRLA